MTDDKYYRRAYAQGSQAYRDGYPSGANPYGRKTRNYGEWLDGWYDAQEVSRGR